MDGRTRVEGVRSRRRSEVQVNRPRSGSIVLLISTPFNNILKLVEYYFIRNIFIYFHPDVSFTYKIINM